jgi:NAD(P)-dependent dehydrogenase (short-subunit alcohol dehydrogenase family)
MDMNDKRVVFLGGATGIGAASIRLFAASGAKVVFGDVQDEPAERLADEAGVAFVHTDATVESDVKGLMDSATEQLGGIDVLVNIAGISSACPITEMEADFWDRTMAVNARSVFFAVKHAVPHIRDAGGGVIVNTASIAAVRGPGLGSTHYAASKGAVLAFTKALSAELAPEIRVNAISPGHTKTGFNDPFFNIRGGYEAFKQNIPTLIPLAREAEPEEMAQGILFLASDASSFMSGGNLVIDGGFVR